MEGLNNTTTVSESTRITGQYVSPEHTESIPLKKVTAREACGGSLRVIIICFFILTLAITIALVAQIRLGDYQLVPHGSVATDSHECSVVGTDVIKKGGNAVDAAVASTLCMGVINPHITGIGGGGFLLIYDHRKRHVLDSIDFREVSPAVMGSGTRGAGLDVGVPGLVRGLATAHQLYGRLPWVDLVMPSVQIARLGFQVPPGLISARSKLPAAVPGNEKLHAWISQLEAGSPCKSPRLAATLEFIATLGPDVLYNGSLSSQILSAVSNAGGFMSQEDLAKYLPVSRPALINSFGGLQVIVPAAPSGGPLLVAMLEVLTASYDSVASPLQTVAALQHVIVANSQSWGNADSTSAETERSSNSTAWNFPEAVGSHVAAIDSDELYVSVVSGLNTLFGSQILTEGEYLLNSALVNFGSGSNGKGPAKRPLSLSTPVIAIQADAICGRRMVLGSGDFSVAAQTLRHLASKNDITNSVEAPRLRITNQPLTFGFETWHEPKFSNATLDRLRDQGYMLQELSEPYQSCNLVEKIGDDLSSHSDSRGQGVASRF